MIEREKEILGKYPNTYTFTKALTERALKKRHGNLKVTICRPSIVIGAYQEPCVGWCESLSAMGGLVFAAMLGVVNFIYCNERQVVDLVPVDYCSNLIIAATCHTAGCPPGTLNIVHSSSSSQHPVKIMDVIQ